MVSKNAASFPASSFCSSSSSSDPLNHNKSYQLSGGNPKAGIKELAVTSSLASSASPLSAPCYSKMFKSGTFTLPKDLNKNGVSQNSKLLLNKTLVKTFDTISSSPLCSRSVSSPVLNCGQFGTQLSPSTLPHNYSTCRQSQHHQQTQFAAPTSSLSQIKSPCQADDSVHLRDVCSKYFTRDEKSGTRPLMMSVYPQTVNGTLRNFKSCVSEKLTQKETIVKQPVEVTEANSYQITCVDGNMTVHGNSNLSQNRYLNIAKIDQEQTVTPHLVQDKHVVVVSCFDNTEATTNLTVKTTPSNDDVNGSGTEPSPTQMPSTSSQDLNYKSSSESGRGTMRSDGNGGNGSTPLDHTSLDSDQSGTQTAVPRDEKHSTTANIIEKMQQELQRILDDGELSTDVDKPSICRLPVVQESDSWVSDSTSPRTVKDNSKPCTEGNMVNGEAKSKNSKANYKSQSDNNSKNSVKSNLRVSEKTPPAVKSSSSKTKSKTVLSPNAAPILNSKSSSKNAPISSPYKASLSKQARKWRYSMDDMISTTTCGLDENIDLTSEYTANTSNWDQDDVRNLRKQLPVLENMYSEVSFTKFCFRQNYDFDGLLNVYILNDRDKLLKSTFIFN